MKELFSTSQAMKLLKVSRTALSYISKGAGVVPEKHIINGRAINFYTLEDMDNLHRRVER